MRSIHFTFLFLILTVLLSSCIQKNIQVDLDDLPTLSEKLLKTIDTSTWVTKIEKKYLLTDLETIPTNSNCCMTDNVRRLLVNYTFTKCEEINKFEEGLLDKGIKTMDLPINNDDTSAVRTYKYIDSSNIANNTVMICRTDDGPWFAVLSEKNTCGPFATIYTLLVNAFDEDFLFSWTGDIEDRPSGMSQNFCRRIYELKTPCDPDTDCGPQCETWVCPTYQICGCAIWQ